MLKEGLQHLAQASSPRSLQRAAIVIAVLVLVGSLWLLWFTQVASRAHPRRQARRLLSRALGIGPGHRQKRTTGDGDAVRAAVPRWESSFCSWIPTSRDGTFQPSRRSTTRSFSLSALETLVRLIHGCQPEEGDHWLSSGSFRTAEGQNIPMYFFMYTRLRNDSWSPEHAAALHRSQNILEEAYEATRSHGMTFVVWGLNDLPQRFERAVAEISKEALADAIAPLLTRHERAEGALSNPVATSSR